MNQKVALITGASSGIGKATAEFLEKNGYYVFAIARRTHRLEAMLGKYRTYYLCD